MSEHEQVTDKAGIQTSLISVTDPIRADNSNWYGTDNLRY